MKRYGNDGVDLPFETLRGRGHERRERRTRVATPLVLEPVNGIRDGSTVVKDRARSARPFQKRFAGLAEGSLGQLLATDAAGRSKEI